MRYFHTFQRDFAAAGMKITRRLSRVAMWLWVFGMAGCGSAHFQETAQNRPPGKAEPLLLREGDVLKVAFPGAPNLNTTQPIRRDGRITLPLVGEITVVGKTSGDLAKDLIVRYSGQLLTKEITVSVESSSFSVYVTGAVLRPGKVDTSRPLTALEAIMEAGGFDHIKANLKEVTVTRTTKGRVEHYTLNLKRILEGLDTVPFYLQPSDIVYVPERFTWF
jgi:polysaccharide export outer membrane protein